MSADDHRALLEQFKPVLRYDSNEGYFADSAAEMTDAPKNVLRDAAGNTLAKPGSGEQELNLGFLAAKGKYPTGQDVAATDVLSAQGRNYIEQYRAMRAKPGYANVVYGRRVETGSEVWLQYWFWFFYNDLRALDVGLGLHEGDWEGIQLRLAGDEPDVAVYAQHAYAAARYWDKVEKREQRPVVYVAQGSHASYFDDGLPFTHWQVTEHFIDRGDGEVEPKSDVRLEPLGDSPPSWTGWPGRWGDTEKPEQGPKLYREISAGSPDGPGRKRQWKDPAYLLRKAEEVGRGPGDRKPAPAAPPPPTQPRLAPERDAQRLRLGYEVSTAADEQLPTHLLVTVNSPDDPFPPTTYRLAISEERGTVELPLELEPERSYELRTSGLTPDGALSRPAESRVAAQGSGSSE